MEKFQPILQLGNGGFVAGCPPFVVLWLSCSKGPPGITPPAPPKPHSPGVGVTGVIAQVLLVSLVALFCTFRGGYAGCFGGVT